MALDDKDDEKVLNSLQLNTFLYVNMLTYVHIGFSNNIHKCN